MKQFFKMFFASLLAMIVAGVIIFGVLIGMIIGAVSSTVSNKPEVAITSNSVLYIDLKTQLREQEQENSLAVISGESGYSPGLYDVVKSLEHAKEDDNIKGIVLRLNPTPNGWATLQQLREAVKDFKTSGKFVYAYGENITQGAYYVATAADSIFLNPVGDLELKGFATVLAFFKGTLDKLEIEPEIFYAGKFKSATEPFRATSMSDANREQIVEFQQDFWDEFVKAVAEYTGTDAAAVNQLVANGTIEFAEDALNNKLVSGLRYSDQVNDLLKEKTGTDEDKEVKLVTIDKYARKLDVNERKADRIAILYAEGSIVDGESDQDGQIASANMLKTIRQIRKNDKIKAVVMRVNSPGGSALASEVILRELRLLQKEKKLIVSMGDVAASGGYYISCYADSIFVMPNTVTGSIGVFTMLFNIENMTKNKLGITFDKVKNAPYADFPSGYRPLTPDEAQRMQRSVDKIYGIFKNHVAEGRHMNVEDVDVIAQGRVWSGTDAVSNGLADAYGDIDRAIESAAAMAGISDYSVVTYPETVDKFEMLLKRMSGAEGVSAAVKSDIEKELETDYPFIKQLKMLKSFNGRAVALMPFSLSMQ
ncbi:MAG: signal peptide peptidase SppA [Chitinophagales bacterium]|nr:signal peptide peptidase SppA [Chitinophagales bacterium]